MPDLWPDMPWWVWLNIQAWVLLFIFMGRKPRKSKDTKDDSDSSDGGY